MISSFLENFLIDAEIFWEQEDEGRINSGPWVETVSGHGECMFEAIAVRTGGRDYLLVQLSRHAYLEKTGISFKRARQLSLQTGQQARREKDLVASKEELESLVREQTQGLLDANRRLRQEMARREKLETQMRQASKMESLGTMGPGGIAHDFNNILSAVMGYAGAGPEPLRCRVSPTALYRRGSFKPRSGPAAWWRKSFPSAGRRGAIAAPFRRGK